MDARELTGSDRRPCDAVRERWLNRLRSPVAPGGLPPSEPYGRIIDPGYHGRIVTMTHEEDNAVVQAVVKQVGGRIPVIAGSGSNCTQTMVEKSLAYQELGADGLLIITPYYNKSNEEGIYRHLKEVADAVDIPCIL